MTSRMLYASLFIALAAALGVCSLVARFSRKSRNRSAGLLVAALIPPVLGNMIITLSGDRTVATIGCMMYYLGMDLLMFALLRFTFDYCRLSWPSRRLRIVVYALLAVDAAQLLLNPITGHAFRLGPIPIDGYDYYLMAPLIGQQFHRIVDYGIFFAALMIFVYQTARAQRLSKERYAIILASMIVGGLWQTYNIFNGIPIDLSMIGFAVFGLLVFYFSMYYRPVRLLERMLSGIASTVGNALFFFEPEGACIWANAKALEMAGARKGDYAAAAEWLAETFPRVSRPGDNWIDSKTIGTGDDARIYTVQKQYLNEKGGGGITGAFISVTDHTEEQREVARQLYIARHDQLTGLYTRDYLYAQVRELLDRNPETDFVITYVDFNDFKLVNDLFGSAFGDTVLCRFADFMRENLSGKAAVFGRLGGDTFGCCQLASGFDPEWLARRLNDFRVTDSYAQHWMHVHIGVYTVTDRSLDTSVMFDRAHLALLSIKGNYQRPVAYYKDEMRASILWNQRISSELPEAIATGQIVPFLQPMVDREGRIVGAEALVRWIHPSDGILPPGSFIPLLENNGMITGVDRHIWRRACEILARWKQEGREEFISINISPKDFAFLDVAAELKGLVKEYGIAPEKLRVEITESVMISDVENPLDILVQLRESGFIVEMDDFGSGYSSLNMLKDMPVDVLKIDMVFLRKSQDTARNRTIVRHIISMAKDLGITSVTEGVETEAQYHALKEMGCELFQGYYFSKPVPVEDFESKLSSVS